MATRKTRKATARKTVGKKTASTKGASARKRSAQPAGIETTSRKKTITRKGVAVKAAPQAGRPAIQRDTIKRVLSQSSGIVYWFWSFAVPDDSVDIAAGPRGTPLRKNPHTGNDMLDLRGILCKPPEDAPSIVFFESPMWISTGDANDREEKRALAEHYVDEGQPGFQLYNDSLNAVLYQLTDETVRK